MPEPLPRIPLSGTARFLDVEPLSGGWLLTLREPDGSPVGRLRLTPYTLSRLVRGHNHGAEPLYLVSRGRDVEVWTGGVYSGRLHKPVLIAALGEIPTRPEQ